MLTPLIFQTFFLDSIATIKFSGGAEVESMESTILKLNGFFQRKLTMNFKLNTLILFHADRRYLSINLQQLGFSVHRNQWKIIRILLHIYSYFDSCFIIFIFKQRKTANKYHQKYIHYYISRVKISQLSK